MTPTVTEWTPLFTKPTQTSGESGCVDLHSEGIAAYFLTICTLTIFSLYFCAQHGGFRYIAGHKYTQTRKEAIWCEVSLTIASSLAYLRLIGCSVQGTLHTVSLRAWYSWTLANSWHLCLRSQHLDWDSKPSTGRSAFSILSASSPFEQPGALAFRKKQLQIWHTLVACHTYLPYPDLWMVCFVNARSP